MSRNALILFCKPPIPGLVKTRLTQERGGVFSQEEAADFFRASMLDVADLSIQALDTLAQRNPENSYDLFVSTTPQENVDLMRELFASSGPWERQITFICDQGSSFDEHIDDAFKQAFDQGYDAVVLIGGDIVMMPPSHLVDAFEWLARLDKTSDVGGFVQAPCQECGLSLVGFTRSTHIDSRGIYYNLSGRAALDGYYEELEANNIPAILLSPVADVDTVEDLSHMISMLHAVSYSAQFQPELYVPRRTLEWIEARGLSVSTPPSINLDPREGIDR